MDLVFEEKPSDSLFVETIWRSQSEQANPFISMADSHYAMVIAKSRGKTILTVRGPETKATDAHEAANVEYFGIRFKHGVFIPYMPAKMVIDRRDINLPEASSRSFWLNGSAWQFPEYENVDTFIDWLIRDGLLVYDPVVESTLKGEPVEMSLRTVQRRFLQATGLTHNTLFQIERARYATALLKQGMSILDTVFEVGYFDQPHLTRSLKHFIGMTPTQITDQNRLERLSFLYNTNVLDTDTIQLQNDNLHKKQIRVLTMDDARQQKDKQTNKNSNFRNEVNYE